MSSWSRPSKVRQHVALSPDPFFARARSGSGNETTILHAIKGWGRGLAGNRDLYIRRLLAKRAGYIRT